jgi:ketosteroid isomerase-like protein
VAVAQLVPVRSMPRVVISLLLVLAVAASCACHRTAQNTISPSPSTALENEATENAEKEIMQLERDWGDALAKRDLVAVDRILGDDHIVITKDGSVLTKAQELAKHGESADELFDFEPMKVRVFGDTAVVTGGHKEKSQYQGRDTSGHYRWMDVFVKRDGRWQAVASELTRVEEGKP